MRLPVLASEPLSASPMPSRIDFLPNSITSTGMSSYLALTTKSATYLVRFCALGAGFLLITFNSAATGKVAIASELVKNFLRSIRVWSPLSRQYRTPKTFELPGLPRRPHALIQHRVIDKRGLNAKFSAAHRPEHQKRARRPSWIWRLSICVEVSLPVLPWNTVLVFSGAAKFGWFMALKSSARN